jgi:hypothetical protein
LKVVFATLRGTFTSYKNKCNHRSNGGFHFVFSTTIDMKKIGTILFLLLFGQSIFAQFTLTEGMGTVVGLGEVTATDHEIANGFDILSYIYNGDAIIATDNPLSPNGGLYAFFGVINESFSMRTINTLGCTTATLSFELWKSSFGALTPIDDTDFIAEYSDNGGGSYTPIAWGNHTSSTPSNWETKSGFILPISSDIRLRFRNATGAQQVRLDGITITGLGPCNFSLPVELLDFTAKRAGNTAQLNWSTASEQNNDYFSVERSSDGRNFAAFDAVRGAGTTTTLQRYEYTDATPLPGLNYYRLKQVDFDGRFKYGPIRSVAVGRRGELGAAPSPATDRLVITLEEAAGEGGDWQVFDAAGRLAQSGVWPAEAGRLDLDVAALPQGIYMFRLVAGPRVQVKAFKKQ